LGLKGVASPSLSSHGRIGLDPCRGHASAPIEPHVPGVHDIGGPCNLLCARGSYFPNADGGIRGGFRGVLRVGIQCAITLIPSLTAAALWPGAAQSNPLVDLAYRNLRDPVRGLHGDWPPF
jgi:hypothetical protein